eukprot:14038793-Alexandrium_andersonii.AAC.1
MHGFTAEPATEKSASRAGPPELVTTLAERPAVGCPVRPNSPATSSTFWTMPIAVAGCHAPRACSGAGLDHCFPSRAHLGQASPCA